MSFSLQMSCVIHYYVVDLLFHDILYLFEKHYELVDSEHNRCMTFLIVKNPADLVVALSEVYVRILTNVFYSISNDILQMTGDYETRDIAEQHYFWIILLILSVLFTKTMCVCS